MSTKNQILSPGVDYTWRKY